MEELNDMEIEISPCPFCGGPGELLSDEQDRDYHVVCVNWEPAVSCHMIRQCAIEGPWRPSKEEAIKLWNTRYARDVGRFGDTTSSAPTEQPVDCATAFDKAKRGLEMPLYTTDHNPFIKTSLDCEPYAREWFSRGWNARQPERESSVQRSTLKEHSVMRFALTTISEWPMEHRGSDAFNMQKVAIDVLSALGRQNLDTASKRDIEDAVEVIQTALVNNGIYAVNSAGELAKVALASLMKHFELRRRG